MKLRPWLILVALSTRRIAFGYQFQTIATFATDPVPRFSLTYAQLGFLIGAYMLLGAFAACWRQRRCALATPVYKLHAALARHETMLVRP